MRCFRNLSSLRTVVIELASNEPHTMKIFNPMVVQRMLALKNLQTLWITKSDPDDVALDFSITDNVLAELQLQGPGSTALQNLLSLRLGTVTDPAIRLVLRSSPLLQDFRIDKLQSSRVNLASDLLQPLTNCPRLLSLYVSIDGVLEAEDVELLPLCRACQLLEQLEIGLEISRW